VRSPLAETSGLGTSLLERLMARPLYSGPSLITKLVRNFRSHPALLAVPAKLFYDSELEACADQDSVSSLLNSSVLPETARGTIPFLVHGVLGKDMREASSPSFFNPAEIVTVIGLVEQLLGEGVEAGKIGVITPYRKQMYKIRDRLPSGVLVGTTEEFQGQERDAVIVSTVRSSQEYLPLDGIHKLGFLANVRRFNVAITRAKSLLCIVGNPYILSHDACWNALLTYAVEKGCYTGCPFDPVNWENPSMVSSSSPAVEQEIGNERAEEQMWASKI